MPVCYLTVTILVCLLNSLISPERYERLLYVQRACRTKIRCLEYSIYISGVLNIRFVCPGNNNNTPIISEREDLLELFFGYRCREQVPYLQCILIQC